MRFRLNIPVNFSNRWCRVERIAADDHNEVYRITGKNKSVVVKNNRPLLRGKGLKHRKIDWQVIEGKVIYPALIKPYYTKSLAYVENLEK